MAIKKRLWLFVGTASFVASASQTMFGEEHTMMVTIVARPDCKSGFGLVSDDEYFAPRGFSRCVIKTDKVNLAFSVGKNIKVTVELSARDGAPNLRAASYKIKGVDPSAAIGTTRQGALEKINSGVGSVAGVLPDPPPVYPTAPPNAPTSTAGATGSNGYVTGLNSCVSGQYITENTVSMFSFKNNCGQTINVKFLRVDGSGGLMHLQPGATHGTGDEPAKMINRPYTYFACPSSYSAVDQSGQQFTRPVLLFQCAPSS